MRACVCVRARVTGAELPLLCPFFLDPAKRIGLYPSASAGVCMFVAQTPAMYRRHWRYMVCVCEHACVNVSVRVSMCEWAWATIVLMSAR